MVRISSNELLQLLEKDGRASFVEMAKRLGTSEAAVRKRVKQLEGEGIIAKYSIELDPKKAGGYVLAHVGVDAAPEAYIRIRHLAKDWPEVRDAWSATGDHMLVLSCRFASSDELVAFVKRVEQTPGVTRTCPTILLERIK